MIKSTVITMAATSLLALSGSVDATMTGTTSSTVTTTDSPDCSGAAASTGVIWPPNHTMVSETIVGVTDPNYPTVTILVTGIMQDESVAALGSGNTSPDGSRDQHSHGASARGARRTRNWPHLFHFLVRQTQRAAHARDRSVCSYRTIRGRDYLLFQSWRAL